MENKTILGILAIILGVIAIVFPLISVEFVQIVAGLAVLFLGIYWIIRGIQLWDSNKASTVLYAIIGLFAMLFGMVLTGNLSLFIETSVLFMYIIGFLMIVFGIVDNLIFLKNSVLSEVSALFLTIKLPAMFFILFGIIILFFADLIYLNPLYLAMIIGIVLIVEGITLIFE